MSGLFPIIGLTLILCLNTLDIVNTLAQPKSFTDDPFIDDEKFTEKGKKLILSSFLILVLSSLAFERFSKYDMSNH